MILKARFVAPLVTTPIENGIVETAGPCIVDVRPARPGERGAAVIDCGDALLMPGFVNAHTHLELTHLAGAVPPVSAGAPDFADWLRRLLLETRRTGDDAATVHAAVTAGSSASLRAGVTTVGDITRLPHLTRPALRHGPLRVVSFGEVIAIGRLAGLVEQRLTAATDPAHNSGRLTAAVSPHAPYTCNRQTLAACREAAARRDLRLCMHLAESEEEAQCTLHGTGPLVDFLRAAGVWDDSVAIPGLSPIAYADAAGLLTPRTMLAHMNYVSDADLTRLTGTGVHVAYCPRTHAAFRHAPHRFRDLRAAGVNVCIGTDSLASNPSLSVLEELRYLWRTFDDIRAAELLGMGTRGGAQALGLDSRVGSLEAGKQADLVAIPLPGDAGRLPLEALLQSDAAPVRVMVAGASVSA